MSISSDRLVFYLHRIIISSEASAISPISRALHCPPVSHWEQLPKGRGKTANVGKHVNTTHVGAFIYRAFILRVLENANRGIQPENKRKCLLLGTPTFLLAFLLFRTSDGIISLNHVSRDHSISCKDLLARKF